MVNFTERTPITPPSSEGEGMIKCTQINLHHCDAAVKTFNKWIANNSKNQTGKIGLICEPYIDETETIIKNFSKDCNVYYENKKGKVRACIVTSKNLDVWPLHQFNNGDQSTIGIKTKSGKTLIFASTYMGHDHTEGPPPPILKNLQKFCESKSSAL